MRTIYTARKRLRFFEKGWTAFERLIDRVSTVAAPLKPYNPLYYLGPLIIFLLIYITITGLYLTLFYRPGSDVAFQSMTAISSTWLGSFMRTSHRYASDMLILITMLHALKVFLSDRFWGSRWLAWDSGWIMVVIFWVVGTMGYFLVWDQAAQWLIEYALVLVKGPFALSFLDPEAAARTFSFFVIILFLHVFIPTLLIVGVLIHVLRMARTRYWTPRWLTIMALISLVAVSLIWPVRSGSPADLTNVMSVLKIDWIYLGFLPLASWMGAPLFWGGSLLLIALLLVIPWLMRGQNMGPSIVIDQSCTGCALCARECPYNAIDMEHRDDDTPFSSLAVVKPNLCTGCGICVGACADDAIELTGLHSAVVRQDMRRTLVQSDSAAHQAPVIIYTCDRHEALGTLPSLTAAAPMASDDLGISLMETALPPRINQGYWLDADDNPQPVMIAVSPCMGMLHPNWAAESIEAGAAGAIMVSCPSHDCAYREGPHWVDHRLKRRRTLRAGNTHLLHLAPGSQREVVSLWQQMVTGDEVVGEAQHAPSVVSLEKDRDAPQEQPSFLTRARYLVPGLALLLVMLVISILPFQGANVRPPEEAQIRLGIGHSGAMIASASNLPPEIAAKIPENVDPATLLGGERFPVQLQLLVDGEPVLDESYRPRGMRKEGSSEGLESYWLPSGEYDIEILLMDDGATWRPVFADMVEIASGESLVLYYDNEEDTFVVQ